MRRIASNVCQLQNEKHRMWDLGLIGKGWWGRGVGAFLFHSYANVRWKVSGELGHIPNVLGRNDVVLSVLLLPHEAIFPFGHDLNSIGHYRSTHHQATSGLVF